MKIKTRILIQTLSASIAVTFILGAIYFLSVNGIRNAVFTNSNELGSSAADAGAYALEVELTEKIDRIAQDTALILDERLNKIEDRTHTIADIAGSFYANDRSRSIKPLPLIMSGDIPPSEPYSYLSPGVNAGKLTAEPEMAGNIGEMLRQIAVADRWITAGSISFETGYNIGMDSYPWPLGDYDPRNSEWYKGAKNTEGLFWTDLYDNFRGMGHAITCSVPIYDNSARNRIFKGVARCTVLFSDFSRMIDSAGTGRRGRLFILNHNGVEIYSTDDSDKNVPNKSSSVSNNPDINSAAGQMPQGTNFLESPNPRVRSLGLSMTLGARGMTELEMNGLPVYVAYAPIHTLGWSLGVAISAQEILASEMLIEGQIWSITNKTRAQLDSYILFLAGIIAVLLLLSLLLIAWFSVRFTHSITGPILILSNGVHEVADGNLEREVHVKTGDELEQLANSFNMMTGQLRKQIAEIARVSAERQRIDTELDIATRIQMSMLPNGFPPFRGRKNEFDLYAQVHPAREVGGDFYDFFFIDDNHFAMIVADVSGKGIPAALYVAITKTIIKNRLQSRESPELALEIINHQLCDNNIMDMFVTAWLCILEINTGSLVFINAGHNPPLLKRGSGKFEFLVSPPDLVLAGMDDTRYHSRRIQLDSGDMLFLYTDGIVEAINTDSAFYGKDRLKNFLDANIDLPLRDLLPMLRNDISDFTSGEDQSDDITMLAIRLSMKHDHPVSVTLQADVDELNALNIFIGKILDDAACPPHERGQIELAAEEIFVNISCYAYSSEEEESNGLLLLDNNGTVTVECRVKEDYRKMTAILTFSDNGRPFNPLERADADITLPLEEREVGGLGLLIVKKTMDTIHFSRDGGVNRLEFSKSWVS